MLEQVLFGGLAVGSIYGLVAMGFAVIFKATEVFRSEEHTSELQSH